MKKINIAAMALASLALLATSCSTEDALDTSAATGQMTFKATQETPGVTSRTTLASDGLTINWVNTDKVGVYDDKMTSASSPAEYSITADATDATKATLTGPSTSGSENFVAVYPKEKCSAAEYSASEISGVTIPNEQTATEGTFDPKAAVMVATATTTDPVFSFKNVCAFLKFKAGKAYTKVEVTATGQISGAVTVTTSDGSATNNSSTEDDKKVTLTGTLTVGSIYYICVVPGSKISKIECYTSDSDTNPETYTMSSSTLAPARNTVYDLGTLGYGEITVATSTIYTGSYNNITKVTFANVKNGNQTFTLSSGSGGGDVDAYADEGCTGTAISDNKIPANGIIYLKAKTAGTVNINYTSGSATAQTITVAKPTLEVSSASIKVNETSTITHKTSATVDGGDVTSVQKSTDSGNNYSTATVDTDYTITNNNNGTYTFTGLTAGTYKVTINGVTTEVITVTSPSSAKRY